MTITERGVPLKCTDNSTHRLIIGMRAMINVEKAYKDDKIPKFVNGVKEMVSPSFADVVNKLDPASPNMTLLSTLVWAGLTHENPDLTPDDALTLIDFDTMKQSTYVIEQLDKAIALAMGIDREAVIAERDRAQKALAEGEVPEIGKKSIGRKSKKSASAISE